MRSYLKILKLKHLWILGLSLTWANLPLLFLNNQHIPVYIASYGVQWFVCPEWFFFSNYIFILQWDFCDIMLLHGSLKDNKAYLELE